MLKKIGIYNKGLNLSPLFIFLFFLVNSPKSELQTIQFVLYQSIPFLPPPFYINSNSLYYLSGEEAKFLRIRQKNRQDAFRTIHQK